MQLGFQFFFSSILLGVGLAMDAFSVSMANGLNETSMKRSKMCFVAGVFAFLQAFMPMLGWICVHTIVEKFKVAEKFIPYIALALLSFIGGKMIYDSVRGCEEDECAGLGFGSLLVQGIAPSIDALSVGFTIAEYDFISALICAIIIAAVTFIICYIGIIIGKKFGTALSNKAQIFGGIILIIIGIEIFITGII